LQLLSPFCLSELPVSVLGYLVAKIV